MNQLPIDCRRDMNLWLYRGWIIQWNVVEPHVPHRVCRQFGLKQHIPEPDFLLSETLHHRLHNLTLRARQGQDWRDIHHEYVAHWENRANNIYQGIIGDGISGDYFHWYYLRTVQSFTNPATQQPSNQYPDWASQQNLYVEGLREVQNMANTTVERYPETQPLMHEFFNIPQQVMDYAAHYPDYATHGSQNFQWPSYEYNQPHHQRPEFFQQRPDFFQQRPSSSQQRPFSSQQRPSSSQQRPGSSRQTPETPHTWIDTILTQSPQEAFQGFRRPVTPYPMQSFGTLNTISSMGSPHQLTMQQQIFSSNVHVADDEEVDQGVDQQELGPRGRGLRRVVRAPPCGTNGRRHH